MNLPTRPLSRARFAAPRKTVHHSGRRRAVILFFLGNLFGYFMLNNMLSIMFAMFGNDL